MNLFSLLKSSQTEKATAIDLFAGCGGLTQGLKDSNFNVIGAIEIDTKARETYTLNHPDVPLIGSDIRNVTLEQISNQFSLSYGELDLLAGCPPCQGFSTLSRKNKNHFQADPRNDLIDEFLRLAKGLFPKVIMLENVPAIIRYEKFRKFVIDLENIGYDVTYQIFDVGNFGVPQRRKRLILSANRTGKAVLGQPVEAKVTVREAISRLAPTGKSGDDLHDYGVGKRSAKVEAIIEAIPKNGGSRSSLPPHLQLECHKKISGFNDVYGRMKWDDLSPTITSGCTNPSKGRFLHPEFNRPITLREAALLQGFPENYMFFLKHGKGAISLMIGNALPPPFIKIHSKAILEGIVL